MRIELKDVSKIYVPDGADFHALSHLDLRFPERGLVCILGPSGCGKTTLLNIIGGLDHPTSGQVLVDGKDLFSQDSHLLDRYRNEQVGFVFQEYDLLGNLNCLDNVRVALDIRRLGREELTDMLEKDGKAELTCDFCGKKHEFTADDLREIIASLDENKTGE